MLVDNTNNNNKKIYMHIKIMSIYMLRRASIVFLWDKFYFSFLLFVSLQRSKTDNTDEFFGLFTCLGLFTPFSFIMNSWSWLYLFIHFDFRWLSLPSVERDTIFKEQKFIQLFPARIRRKGWQASSDRLCFLQM